MSRPAQFTPEEIRQRRNARSVARRREKMKDPVYRERFKAYWRDWYASGGKKNVIASVQRWRTANPERRFFANKKGTTLREQKYEWAIEFTDLEWPTHCPALGIELNYTEGAKGGHAHANSPSLDRVDNARGYVKGNVIVVSQLANRIKTSATPAQLMAVAQFYASRLAESTAVG